MPAAIGQTVTIVNKSGKIVKTSKHLVNVFNEAKSAYAEKKAEIKALRQAESNQKEAKLRQQLEALKLEDDAVSRVSSRRSSGDGQTIRRKPSPLKFDANGESFADEPHMGELVRRRTYEAELTRPRTPVQKRSTTHDAIDMDLAYGELPPPLPESNRENEIELRNKVTALQRMLDEANCVQHSVTATIDGLQKNPEALAAVALTLAEISNLAMKMAPTALTSLKTSFPVVLALLASPQFAIAVGVGVGVTVIAFGGYKIVKKIKQQKQRADSLLEYSAEPEGIKTPESDGEDELRELNGVERWRRGVADSVAEGGDSEAGTSVEGEFLTPTATRTLIEEGKIKESDLKSTVTSKTKKSSRHQDNKSEKAKKKSKSEAHSRTSHSHSSSSKAKAEKKEKKKEPSGLKMLFKGQSVYA
ncbi:hypothetical protein K431DRAFT_229036 [Polychaeton citri CBS 116435]|uniref:Uncharacterized protein n=1 Tax=Polychaeton citri CBS 116435 TaxID=1314669 RepID=A0A9P4UNP2_9PEZI|nr:hypothetical protein K431DRAFT_229036 [Polychaeton citri CBS 116435]